MKIPTYNNNIVPIDILIYSSPKTGGNTLETTFKNKNFKVYYTHNNNFFKSEGPICQNNNMNIIDYINIQVKFRKDNIISSKLNIIGIYRTPIERLISLFFQNYNIINIDNFLSNKSINELIIEFNNKHLDLNSLDFTICELYDLNLYFNNDNKLIENLKNGHCIIELNKYINIILLNFNNINEWDKILSNIFNKTIKTINANYSKNKDYNLLYNDFKTKYYINNFIFNFITNNKNIKQLLPDNDYINYINYWNSKITKNKTLIGKNHILFLQNDTNNTLVNLNNNNNYLEKYYNILPKYDNIITFIYPNKNIIYNDSLPNYININNIYYNDYIKNNYYYVPSLYNKLDFYKYDTHINIKGNIKTFTFLFDKLNINYDSNLLNINVINNYLEGYGDLLWENNIDNNLKNDIAFFCDKNFIKTENNYTYKNINMIYNNTLTNIKNNYNINILAYNYKTDEYDIISNNSKLNWDILSKYILIIDNNESLTKLNVLIFYDSFSIQLMHLFILFFKKCIFVKRLLDINIYNKYKCDLCLNLINLRFLIKNK